jgi:hypothetical protein
VFAKLAEGHALACNYKINNHTYTKGYYLADEIYPRWAMFVKKITKPSGQKKSCFAKHRDSCRKDIERAFGVL